MGFGETIYGPVRHDMGPYGDDEGLHWGVWGHDSDGTEILAGAFRWEEDAEAFARATTAATVTLPAKAPESPVEPRNHTGVTSGPSDPCERYRAALEACEAVLLGIRGSISRSEFAWVDEALDTIGSALLKPDSRSLEEDEA